jgi:hypothetical protein
MVASRLTFEINLRLAVRAAALAFNPVDHAWSSKSEKRLDALATSIAADVEASVEQRDDDFGFRWLILRGRNLEDVAISLGVLAEELGRARHPRRPLCAAFAFEDRRDARNGRDAYWIYNFERGAFYPFVPRMYGGRDVEREAQLATAVDGELELECDRGLWFPVWELPV